MIKLKLSNVWENFPEFLQKIRPIDYAMAQRYGDAPKTITGDWWRSFCERLCGDFEMKPRFAEMFDGYTAEERTALKSLIGRDQDIVVERLLEQLRGQKWQGIVFGSGREEPRQQAANTRGFAEAAAAYRAIEAERDAAIIRRDAFARRIPAKASKRDSLMMRKFRGLCTAVSNAELRMEKLEYDVNAVTRLVRKLGVEASKSMTTAVKGWHQETDGYKIGPGYVSLYGFNGVEKYKEILAGMLGLGFTITSSDPPERGGKGLRASIFFEPFHSKEELSATGKA